MKTFSRNIMLFIFLCLSIEAQEKWMLLDKQPEIYFNFYDSDGANYVVHALYYLNGPIFDENGKLTQDYDEAWDNVLVLPNIWSEHVGFDHINSPNAGLDGCEVVAFGYYRINILRKTQTFSFFLNLRHYSEGFNDMQFSVYANNSQGIYDVKHYYGDQFIETVYQNQVINCWDRLGEQQDLSHFFNSSDTIISDLTISNENYNNISGNLTINNGVLLTLNNANLQFGYNSGLIVNGSISANSVSFTNNSSTSNWNGIQFNSGSTGNLDYCTITNASTGIYCYNSSPTIKHSTLDYNGTGLSCNEYSSPVLVGNNFRNNTSYGLRLNNYSSPNLTDNGYPGTNVIRNNTTGIFASYSSNPNLNGYMTYGNSVFNNSSYEIMAYYYCTVNADRVFWNAVPPPSSEFATIGSTINRNYPLSTNPNPNRSIIEKGMPVNFIASSETISYDIAEDDLSQALEMQRQKRYDEAIALFLEVFKKNKDELVGKYALTKIEECFTQSGRKDYLSFSEKEIKPNIPVGNETYVIALELEAHQMVNTGEYSEAINNLTTILTKYNLNENIEKNTLFTLGSFYTLFSNNKTDADNYFNTLKTKYPEDDLTSQIEIIKGMGNSLEGDKKIILPNPEIKSESINNNAEISISNYPNPFNPETTISFSLPQSGNVKLLIYDVLGREVFSIAEGYHESGRHEVKFDGRSLSTGIYFYVLETGGKRFTNKMILMK